MTIAAPLDAYRTTVRREWLDYNGHMNVAYYLLVFDQASDVFLDWLGLDEPYRERTGGTTFAVDTRVTYDREVKLGDPLRVTTQLLGHDAKRLHFFHHMYHAEDGSLAATNEWLSLHVDLNQRRVVAMPAEILDRLAAVAAAHDRLPRPEQAGRGIRMPDRKPA